MEGSTIIGAPFEAHPHLRSLLADQMQPAFTSEEEGEGKRLFKIRTADSSGGHENGREHRLGRDGRRGRSHSER